MSKPKPSAGARVRIVIEDTIESADSDLVTTGGITLTGLTDTNALIQLLTPGWQVGDIAHDGHGQLNRIRRDDGVELWQRPNGRPVYDDETSLASLTLYLRAVPATTNVIVTTTRSDETGRTRP